MKTILIVSTLLVFGVLAYVRHDVESAGSVQAAASGQTLPATINPAKEVAVGDRYLVPALPPDIVDRLPIAEAISDQYLSERIALAELVIGGKILAAEDLVTSDAGDLPGIEVVLQSDGFYKDTDGDWSYDRFTSWMRFPLIR